MSEPESRPEKRKDRRFSIRVPIYVALDHDVVRKTIHIESRDVSAGGVSFETGRELPLAADTQLVLGPLGSSPAVTIRGRVVWTRQIPETGRYLVGVQFTDYEGLSRQELAARVEALAKK
jgi:c-di-GMP-binding flagellar brake protein YcgR